VDGMAGGDQPLRKREADAGVAADERVGAGHTRQLQKEGVRVK
jgi:hypothetical protein